MKNFYEKYSYLNQLGINQSFVDACTNGHLDEVKYLLHSKEIKYNADIHYEEDWAFRNACYQGNLHIVKYLLASPELIEHADIHAQKDLGLILACENGHFNIVKYMLTSTDLKEYASIHAIGPGNPLSWAACNNHLEIVKYLLFSPELKEHSNLHAEKDIAFEWACSKNNLDTIQYFIFDLNIPRSEYINKYLKESPNEHVEKMFKVREINKELTRELKSNSSQVKKNKV